MKKLHGKYQSIEGITNAMAASVIQNAMNKAKLTPMELSRKMGNGGSRIHQILSGEFGMSIRTLSRALYACGFEVRFCLVKRS